MLKMYKYAKVVLYGKLPQLFTLFAFDAFEFIFVVIILQKRVLCFLLI